MQTLFLSLLLLVFLLRLSSLFGEDGQAPRLQVVIGTADWCFWCKKFEKETLSHWQKNGWPIGHKASSLIRLQEGVNDALPCYIVMRDGKEVAKHVGYLTREQFREFVHRHIPEWWEEKTEKPAMQSQPVLQGWDYKTNLIGG